MEDEKENLVKVRKAKEGLFLPLPEILCSALDIKKGDEIRITINEDGQIFARKKLDEEDKLCQICKKRPHRNTCINCKRKVCSNCFWRMGGICTECGYVGKKGGK